jgi:hypothetical protein
MTCALLCACGNKQVTQERDTDSATDSAGTTAGSAEDPSGVDAPEDDDASTTGITSTSSPTEPTASMTTNVSDTDTDSNTDTDPGTGSTSFATDFTSGLTTTGGDAFWCADADLGEMATPVSYSDSNFGRTDANLGSCTDGANGDEFLVAWTPSQTGTFTIDTIGSEIDTVLYVLEDCGGTELVCNDDIDEKVLQSSVTIFLFAGETILIVVDGFNAAATGAFELYISM